MANEPIQPLPGRRPVYPVDSNAAGQSDNKQAGA